MNKEIKNFVDGVELFYSTFLDSTAKSVMVLADLQEKFPNDYSKMKEIQSNPSAILEKLGDLNDEDKDRLIAVLIRTAALERKMLKLFDMSLEEKRKLADEIEEFVKSIKEGWLKK